MDTLDTSGIMLVPSSIPRILITTSTTLTSHPMEEGSTPWKVSAEYTDPDCTQAPSHNSCRTCCLRLRLMELLDKLRLWFYTIRPWKTPVGVTMTWCWCAESWKLASSFFYSSIKRLSRCALTVAAVASPGSNFRWNGGGGVLSRIYSMIFMVLFLHHRFAHGCSSRSTPKPKPVSPSLRPNITIRTFTCPQEYDAHYCLNGATCFTVKIGESILYNCECSDGYMGQRCEFKDLDGSYYPIKQRALLEQAGITSCVVFIIIFVVLLLTSLYLRARGAHAHNRKHSRSTGTVYGSISEDEFSNPKAAIATAMLIKRPFSA